MALDAGVPDLARCAELALRWVREAPVIAYDTETSGLDWKTMWPVGYVVTVDPVEGGGLSSVYVPVRHGGGGNLMDASVPPLSSVTGPFVQHPFERELNAAFAYRAQAGLKTVGHNLKFDLNFSARAGVRVLDPMECTQINAALLDEHAGRFSLAACAMRHHLTPKKGDVLYAHLARQFGGPPAQKQMANFWRLAGTDPVGWDYAAGDGITTLELWRHQIASRDAQPFDMSQVWKLESDLIRVISRIERRGMKIDLDRAKEVGDLLHAEVADLRAELPPDFNVRSPSQVRGYCESLGRTDWPMTAPSGRFPRGQPSFTEKWLETFPEGKRIVEVREATNLGNSFLNPLLTRHVFNDRVFPQLHATAQDEFGTISGRFSCSDPNMQQVPKHNKKLGKLFRSIFIPDEGMVLYEGDYSQCEPRLFAHYTQEESLIAGYSSDPPRDMHRVCADLMSVDRDTIAKRMNMGLLTGMQIKTFAGHMGWDEDHARQMFNTWMRTFPGIPEFQQRAKQAMMQRGWVRTLLGRVCRLDDPRFAYKAVSRIIQGGNADIVKQKLVDADRWLESEGDVAQVLMTIHDSFLWQAPMGEVGDRVVAELRRILVDVQSPPFSLRVPFKLDIGGGMNWAEATYGGKK